MSKSRKNAENREAWNSDRSLFHASSIATHDEQSRYASKSGTTTIYQDKHHWSYQEKGLKYFRFSIPTLNNEKLFPSRKNDLQLFNPCSPMSPRIQTTVTFVNIFLPVKFGYVSYEIMKMGDFSQWDREGREIGLFLISGQGVETTAPFGECLNFFWLSHLRSLPSTLSASLGRLTIGAAATNEKIMLGGQRFGPTLKFSMKSLNRETLSTQPRSLALPFLRCSS